MSEQRYLEPGWFTRNVFNRSVRRLTRWGISVMGSRELGVVGRVSGKMRTTPVNLMNFEGQQYLVSPRGHSQWVRNLRAAGGGELRVGRKVTTFTAVDLADADKEPVLREYLRRWSWEVGAFFDGLDAKSSPEKLAEVAPSFPVFVITSR